MVSLDPPPSRRDDLRGHDARRRGADRRSRRSCSTARTARTSTTCRRGARRGRRPAQGAQVQPPGARTALPARGGQRDRARLPVHQQRHDAGLRRPASLRHDCEARLDTISADLAKAVLSVRATPGDPIRITKYVAYHTSTGVPAVELADRCSARSSAPSRTGRAAARGQADVARRVLGDSDIELTGDDTAQQALRWNLFQLAQATARTQEQGVAAKGSPPAGTTATTSGTPRCTSPRSSPTPTPRPPAS